MFQDGQAFPAYFDTLENAIGVEKEASNYEADRDGLHNVPYVVHVKHFCQDQRRILMETNSVKCKLFWVS